MKSNAEQRYKKQFERMCSCFGIREDVYGSLGIPALAVIEEDSIGRGHRCWLVDNSNCIVKVGDSYARMMKSLYGKTLHHQTYGGLPFDGFELRVPETFSALEVELAVRGF